MGGATGGQELVTTVESVAHNVEIPAGQFLPTHVNRNPSLFEEGIEWARAGGLVDVTTSTVPAFLAEGEVKCATGLRRMIEAGAWEVKERPAATGQFTVGERVFHQKFGYGRVLSVEEERAGPPSDQERTWLQDAMETARSPTSIISNARAVFLDIQTSLDVILVVAAGGGTDCTSVGRETATPAGHYTPATPSCKVL